MSFSSTPHLSAPFCMLPESTWWDLEGIIGLILLPWGMSCASCAAIINCVYDFTFTLHLHALEKEMATHSSVLAWRIPVPRYTKYEL